MKKREAEMLFGAAMGYIADNHPDELKWARKIKPFINMTPKEFLWMYSWVIYTAGFKVSVIEDKFPKIQKAFKNFDIDRIARMKSLRPVLKVFSNGKKASSLVKGTKEAEGTLMNSITFGMEGRDVVD